MKRGKNYSYKMGRMAYRANGVNPHTFGTPDYEQWLRGWHDERRDIQVKLKLQRVK